MKKRVLITSLIIILIFFNLSNGILSLEQKTIEKKEKVFFSNEYDMIIVTPKKFSLFLIPLVIHKNKIGVKTKIVTTDQVEKYKEEGKLENVGRDEAETLKYFIKYAIEKWNIEYVLLVGNEKYIPVKKIIWGSQYITDLYYEDIYDEYGNYSDWEDLFDFSIEYNKLYFSNESELISHINNNTIDEIYKFNFFGGYPDVAVGRIPCIFTKDLINVVRKIILYERGIGQNKCFNRLLLIGGDTFKDSDCYEGEVLTNEIAKIMDGFEKIKIWASLGNLNNKKMLEEINKGVGLICYAGHGSPRSLYTYNPDGEDFYYNLDDNRFLFNFRKLPIIFFNACSTAKISRSCIAWDFVNKPYGGAIASIGATNITHGVSLVYENNTYIYGCDLFGCHFFNSYEEGITLGNMYTKAQTNYIDEEGFFNAVLDFILIGDPSLKLGGYR